MIRQLCTFTMSNSHQHCILFPHVIFDSVFFLLLRCEGAHNLRSRSEDTVIASEHTLSDRDAVRESFAGRFDTGEPVAGSLAATERNRRESERPRS